MQATASAFHADPGGPIALGGQHDRIVGGDLAAIEYMESMRVGTGGGIAAASGGFIGAIGHHLLSLDRG
ncbi:hypothetical protein D3C71_2069860 [compost metagenome]